MRARAYVCIEYGGTLTKVVHLHPLQLQQAGFVLLARAHLL
eukprot:COSAG01_NODE_48021_length_384_cov_41.221053_1_plen_40_part_10